MAIMHVETRSYGQAREMGISIGNRPNNRTERFYMYGKLFFLIVECRFM